MGRYGIDWDKGLKNFTDEDYDKIMIETTKIINKDEPSDLLPGAYYDRGIINYNRDNYDNAISDFTSALQLHCIHPFAAYYNRGLAFYCKKQYEKALSDFYEAEHINPNDPEIKNMIQQIIKIKI